MAGWHSEGAWVRFKDADTLWELGVIENLRIIKVEGNSFPYLVRDQNDLTQGGADDFEKALGIVDWIMGVPDEEDDDYPVPPHFRSEENVLNKVLTYPRS